MNKINEYKNKFPFGLEEFCRALSNPERVAIASLLYTSDRLLNYEEIVGLLGKDVKINLDAMLNLGVIKRTGSIFVNGIFISDFELNKIYKRLIENCIQILKNQKEEKMEVINDGK